MPITPRLCCCICKSPVMFRGRHNRIFTKPKRLDFSRQMKSAMLRIRKSLLHCLCLQLKPAGTLCRESSNSCDLPEFCTGANPHCPANVYLHDGHACHSVEGYCYNGICQNHEQQCITLWGPGKSKLYCVHNSHVYKGILHLIW